MEMKGSKAPQGCRDPPDPSAREEKGGRVAQKALLEPLDLGGDRGIRDPRVMSDPLGSPESLGPKAQLEIWDPMVPRGQGVKGGLMDPLELWGPQA